MSRLITAIFYLTIFALVSCSQADQIKAPPKKITYIREIANQTVKPKPPPTEIIINNVQAKVLSKSRALISWATNIPTQGEVDISLLSDDGQVEEVFAGITSEYPQVNYYKNHKIILDQSTGIKILPGRKYSFMVRAYGQESQTATAPGPQFQTTMNMRLSLFVQNGDSQILIYPFPNDNPQLAPTVKINNPRGHTLVHSAYDSIKDVLYMTTSQINGILVFTNVKSDEVASETRIIEGPSAKLNRPAGLFVDENNDVLYVANNGSNAITIYDKASILQGDISPNRVIEGRLSWVKGPSGITVDIERNVLYVSCHSGNGDALLAFYPANKVDGEASPVGKLFGSVTHMKFPMDVAFDQKNKHLYVLNESGEVIVFHEQAGATYNPYGRERLNGMRKPNRIIKNKDWWLQVVPNEAGGLAFDTSKNRLFIAGRPLENSRYNVITFNNASALDGKVAPDLRISSGKSVEQSRGISVDNESRRLFVIDYDKGRKSVLTAFDISDIENEVVKVVKTRVQLSPFSSPITGITFDNVKKRLIASAGTIFSFAANTIQTAWNYFNAEQAVAVMDGSEVTVGAYGKTVYDSKRGILYALNKKNNRLDAFDSIYSNSAEFLSLEPSRKINPDIDNHLLVDYKVDEKKNTVYFLYRPLSSADKNLKVLYFENADGLNNLVRADKFIVASEIVTKIVSPDSEFEYGEGRYDNYFLLETDLNSGKIFITQNGRLEIFSSVEDIERQYGEGQLAQVKPLKVILGSLANFGTPTALYFYVPEEQSHASYLLLSTVGRVSGVVGFDERVLDASTRDIYPIFNLTSEQNGLTNPQKIAIGNLSE